MMVHLHRASDRFGAKFKQQGAFMSLAEMQQYMSTPNIYAYVTQQQIAALTVQNYMTTVNGVTYVGTFDPVPALAAQALS